MEAKTITMTEQCRGLQKRIFIVSSFLHLFILFSAPPLISAANKRLDVCADPSAEKALHWRQFHEGIFIDISTGEKAGIERDSQGQECALDLKLNETHGERTEVSFFKDADRDVVDCFDIIYEDRDDT